MKSQLRWSKNELDPKDLEAMAPDASSNLSSNLLLLFEVAVYRPDASGAWIIAMIVFALHAFLGAASDHLEGLDSDSRLGRREEDQKSRSWLENCKQASITLADTSLLAAPLPSPSSSPLSFASHARSSTDAAFGLAWSRVWLFGLSLLLSGGHLIITLALGLLETDFFSAGLRPSDYNDPRSESGIMALAAQAAWWLGLGDRGGVAAVPDKGLLTQLQQDALMRSSSDSPVWAFSSSGLIWLQLGCIAEADSNRGLKPNESASLNWRTGPTALEWWTDIKGRLWRVVCLFIDPNIYIYI
ncbi:unnamed protein product [Protopolystoma xenopodis]|uniref:Uncharacterized protein n=1 Tax=Protopolystoma xenopodis TaxID=117903 RepID=A0A3S5BXB9_9PLAT|nr:unnamed protein product [Protopolystoma xenopodis]